MASKNKTPDAFPLTIDEFCAGLSQSDQRVEMIGAFCAEEKRLGNLRDDGVSYQKRYTTFCIRPVN